MSEREQFEAWLTTKREAQADKLEALSREIVKLHKERGCVLTAHIEQMADLLAEIDAIKESQQ